MGDCKTKNIQMSSLKLHKRIASSILKCGKRRVWFDPTELPKISKANSRNSLHKLVACGLVAKKPFSIRSRSRSRRNAEAKSKGRHSGLGKRRGTREARISTKSLWIRHMRVL